MSSLVLEKRSTVIVGITKAPTKNIGSSKKINDLLEKNHSIIKKSEHTQNLLKNWNGWSYLESKTEEMDAVFMLFAGC